MRPSRTLGLPRRRRVGVDREELHVRCPRTGCPSCQNGTPITVTGVFADSYVGTSKPADVVLRLDLAPVAVP